MASSLYGSDSCLIRRQPCAPSVSGSSRLRAAPVARRPVSGSRASPMRVQATLAEHAQHDCNSHDFAPYQAPEWHPKLFLPYNSKREHLESQASALYNEVWNSESVELLGQLAAPGVVFSDILGLECDCFGVAAVQQQIAEFQSSHPLLRYSMDDIIVDEDRDTVVVHYTATAAHLLPSKDGVPATGHVSTVSGMDKIKFDRSCHITSIQSYRQRFMDEEVQMIDWDTV